MDLLPGAWFLKAMARAQNKTLISQNCLNSTMKLRDSRCEGSCAVLEEG